MRGKYDFSTEEKIERIHARSKWGLKKKK
jgi:hypothetical protein